MRASLLVLLIAGLLVVPPSGRARAQSAVGACGDPSAPYAEVQIDPSPRIDLELARTAQEHQVGLMNREYLPPDSGMLFIYTAQSREGYWMYHTLIPLSIAWIDRDGTIVDIQDMNVLNNPSDEQEAARTVYDPAAPYWYALEVSQSWFFDHGVGVGQQILFCLGGA
jgi:uncharacterized membrane protein (UPF0127 family)